MVEGRPVDVDEESQDQERRLPQARRFKASLFFDHSSSSDGTGDIGTCEDYESNYPSDSSNGS